MHNVKRHFYIVFCLLVIVSAIFFIWPSIDLKTSHLFLNTYSFAEGPMNSGQFFMRGPIFKLAQKLVDILFAAALIVSGLLVAYAYFKQKRNLLVGSLFIFLSFALGPGLLVNAILKNHWGRPRPYYTQGFIWHKPYVRVWEISNECDHNCSFVSGDSSTAFAFLAFAFLPFRKRRWKVLLAGFAGIYFLLNGTLRVIHGAHYISDVVIGALLVYLVVLGCYQFCYRSNWLQNFLNSRLGNIQALE
jgi:lipid A 4'-phosphatase